MTADEFRAWLERRALTYYRAAPLLAADQTEVSRWARGERKIGRRLARIVELLDEKECAEARLAALQEKIRLIIGRTTAQFSDTYVVAALLESALQESGAPYLASQREPYCGGGQCECGGCV